MSHQQPAQTTNSNLSTRKKRRGMIEKRRRDKINNSLCELRRLVPAAFEKQGSAKLEKAEILQLTVDYLRMLHARGLTAADHTRGSATPIMTPTFAQSANNSLPLANSLTPLMKLDPAGDTGGPNSSSSDHSPPLSVSTTNNNHASSNNNNSSSATNGTNASATATMAFGGPTDVQQHHHHPHHNYHHHHLAHHHHQHHPHHHHHHQVTGAAAAAAAAASGDQVTPAIYPPNYYYYV